MASASASAALGVSHDTGVKVSTSESVGQNDLLIVWPGVLGRVVAEKWQQEYPGCKIFVQTTSTDHHSELTEVGIIPSLKGSRLGQKVPYVIFCAPPYHTDDYPGDLCYLNFRLHLFGVYHERQHQIGMGKALSCLHQVLLRMTAMTMDFAVRILLACQLAGDLVPTSF